MKTLLLILCFFNPSKLSFNNYEEVIFKRGDTGFWKGGNNNDLVYMSANPTIWIIYRKEKLKVRAGYCEFKAPNVIGPVKVIAIFPKPGFKMKQNLFTYKLFKNNIGTYWNVWDANGTLIMTGD